MKYNKDVRKMKKKKKENSRQSQYINIAIDYLLCLIVHSLANEVPDLFIDRLKLLHWHTDQLILYFPAQIFCYHLMDVVCYLFLTFVYSVSRVYVRSERAPWRRRGAWPQLWLDNGRHGVSAGSFDLCGWSSGIKTMLLSISFTSTTACC